MVCHRYGHHEVITHAEPHGEKGNRVQAFAGAWKERGICDGARGVAALHGQGLFAPGHDERVGGKVPAILLQRHQGDGGEPDKPLDDLDIVAAVLCAGFLFWCLSIHDQTGRITLGCLTLFFGVLLAVNAFLGPTCRVQIYTTLGSESLPSLGRLRTLRKAMEMLRPRLASAQGEVNAADIPQRLAEVASRPAIQYHTPERPRNNYSGAVHGWLFGMMLLNVAFIAFYVVAQGILPGVLVLFGTMALAGITVIALVKQHGSELGGALRTLAWVALGYVIACLVSGYVLMVYTVVLHPGISNDQAAIFKRMVAIPVMGTQWLLTVYCVFAGLALIVALTGLFLVMDSRRRAPAVRPTP